MESDEVQKIWIKVDDLTREAIIRNEGTVEAFLIPIMSETIKFVRAEPASKPGLHIRDTTMLTKSETEKISDLAKSYNGGISNAFFAGAEALATMRSSAEGLARAIEFLLIYHPLNDVYKIQDTAFPKLQEALAEYRKNGGV